VRLRIKKAEKTIEIAEKRGKRSAVSVAEAWLVHLESLEDWAKGMVEARRDLFRPPLEGPFRRKRAAVETVQTPRPTSLTDKSVPGKVRYRMRNLFD